MIPILSGIIVNHGHAVTHLRAFVLSLAYVLGMAITYAAVGVAAGFSGTLLSAALQNAWVLGSFALVFVVLSFSMFGFYELQLPAALQSKLSDTANQQGGSLAAIALMGALSALIVGPCVAAPLAGALLYIAQTNDAVLGGAALFAMGLGMGAPLLIVGVFSRSFLPKAGPWMEAVKKFFGVVLLAIALWLVSPVLPSWAIMLGWASLLIVPAIYLHALDPLPPHAARLAALLEGHRRGAAAHRRRDAARPARRRPRSAAAAGFPAWRRTAAAVSPAPTFEKVKTVAELDARLAAATKTGDARLLCRLVRELQGNGEIHLRRSAVAAKMQEFTLLKADVTANNDDDKALLKRFGLFGPPGIIFFDKAGQEITGQRVVGYQPAAQFLGVLEKAQK